MSSFFVYYLYLSLTFVRLRISSIYPFDFVLGANITHELARYLLNRTIRLLDDNCFVVGIRHLVWSFCDWHKLMTMLTRMFLLNAKMHIVIYIYGFGLLSKACIVILLAQWLCFCKKFCCSSSSCSAVRNSIFV